ncbi:MAG TPA: ligase-associated DNA damage response endonuclease PdeM [Casimicrobiaceae bacterium]|nr:ligase-associated DNA damage response endonuclease PdeM [Casimicrobiaceae bacterium]
MFTAPLAFAADDPSASAPHRMRVHLAGESVDLCADRAVYWPGQATLFIADLHLGKAASFRAAGVPLPRGSTDADLARLTQLLEATAARRLVVLGDFLHAASARVPALDRAFAQWRSMHPALSILLVRGNHDAQAGDPPPDWNIDSVAEPHALPPFLACHRPHSPPSGFALCGHVHPGVVLGGRARESVRLPCFLIGRRAMLLPAFGGLTGLAIVNPAADETVVVIAGSRLFRLAA